VTTVATNVATSDARQRDIEPAARDQRHLDVAESAAAVARRSQKQRHSRSGPPASDQWIVRITEASAIHNGDRTETTDSGALALRQHDVGQTEKDRRGVDRQARPARPSAMNAAL